MADGLAGRFEQLIELWESLGDASPTFASPEAGAAEVARERYLIPLGRVFLGALRGSKQHEAVYLDERLRYVDASLTPQERRDMLAPVLDQEFVELAKLVGDDIPEPDDVLAALVQMHRPLLDTTPPDLRVLFIGDCVFVETRAFLLPAAGDDGYKIDTRHVFFSARQPLDEVNTAITNAVESFRPDIIALSLFTFDGVPPYSAAWRSADLPLLRRNPRVLVESLGQLVRETIDDIRTVSNAPIAVHAPAGLPLGPLRRLLTWLPAHSSAQRTLVRALGASVEELVEHTENTVLIDESEAVAEVGGVRRAADPIFAPDDVPPGYFHTTRLGPALARSYAELVNDYQLLRAKKAIFVDFDHTLWSGVMGEGAVRHNVEYQRLLKSLMEAGVLLIALSKNDPSLIRWDEMMLTPDDFALMKINWLPKPDNAAAAIEELNLAASAFVLVDDNAAERALVTEHVPGVDALDSGDPRTWRTLRRWLDFPSTRQTEESRRRTSMYREAAARRSAMAGAHDYDTMMKSLALTFEVRRAGRADLDRLQELFLRTNQFNTTTIRYSESEIDNILDSEDFAVHVCTLRDRFGELGVIATSVFSIRARCFDSFVMSCRAMGFGVELALLRRVIDEVGHEPIAGRFVPTERNGPAATLYERAGFRADESDEGLWHLDPAVHLPDVPQWLGEKRAAR